MPAPVDPAPTRTRTVRVRVDSEFGARMRDLLRSTPGALCAVLTDNRGDAVDYAYSTGELEEFDVEVTGAQIEQVVEALHRIAVAHGLRRPVLLLETRARALLAAALHGRYVLAMILSQGSDLPRAMGQFRVAARDMGQLLL